METVGTLADKLTVWTLKAHRLARACDERAELARIVRDDLAAELSALLAGIADGSVRPCVQPNLKLYGRQRAS